MANLTSPRGVRMKGWLPPLYQSSRVMDGVLEAEGREADAVRTAASGILDQFFVSTATWTLDRWEAEVGLPVSPAQPASERRDKIISRIRGYGTSTLAMLKTVARAYFGGEIDIVEDFTAHTLIVLFVDVAGVPPNLTDFENALSSSKQAQLALIYEYRWSIWDRVDAADLTWDEVDALALTWDQWDVHF